MKTFTLISTALWLLVPQSNAQTKGSLAACTCGGALHKACGPQGKPTTPPSRSTYPTYVNPLDSVNKSWDNINQFQRDSNRAVERELERDAERARQRREEEAERREDRRLLEEALREERRTLREAQEAEAQLRQLQRERAEREAADRQRAAAAAAAGASSSGGGGGGGSEDAIAGVAFNDSFESFWASLSPRLAPIWQANLLAERFVEAEAKEWLWQRNKVRTGEAPIGFNFGGGEAPAFDPRKNAQKIKDKLEGLLRKAGGFTPPPPPNPSGGSTYYGNSNGNSNPPPKPPPAPKPKPLFDDLGSMFGGGQEGKGKGKNPWKGWGDPDYLNNGNGKGASIDGTGIPDELKFGNKKDEPSLADIMKLSIERWNLIDEKHKAAAELRSGHFCSECRRTQSEIEKTGVGFAEHVKKAKGTVITLTEAEIQVELANKFSSRENDLAARQKALDNWQAAKPTAYDIWSAAKQKAGTKSDTASAGPDPLDLFQSVHGSGAKPGPGGAASGGNKANPATKTASAKSGTAANSGTGNANGSTNPNDPLNLFHAVSGGSTAKGGNGRNANTPPPPPIFPAATGSQRTEAPPASPDTGRSALDQFGDLFGSARRAAGDAARAVAGEAAGQAPDAALDFARRTANGDSPAGAVRPTTREAIRDWAHDKFVEVTDRGWRNYLFQPSGNDNGIPIETRRADFQVDVESIRKIFLPWSVNQGERQIDAFSDLFGTAQK